MGVEGRDINLRRLYWVGPATIAAAVLAVAVVQQISLMVLPSLPRFSAAVLQSDEPAAVTAVLGSAAVATFVAVVRTADRPLRTFQRLALGVLLLSFTPNAAAVPVRSWYDVVVDVAAHGDACGRLWRHRHDAHPSDGGALPDAERRRRLSCGRMVSPSFPVRPSPAARP